MAAVHPTTPSKLSFEPVNPSPGLRSPSIVLTPALTEGNLATFNGSLANASTMAVASPVLSVTDALDDIRAKSSEVIDILSARIQELNVGAEDEAAKQKIEEDLGTFSRIYVSMVEGEVQKYSNWVKDAKNAAKQDDARLEAAYDALKDFLLQTVEVLESWEAHKVHFAGLHELLIKVSEILDSTEIESALAFDKFYEGTRLWRQFRDLTDLDILRTLPNGQEAALAKRFIVLEEIGGALVSDASIDQRSETKNSSYGQIEELIQDQIKNFAFLLKAATGDKETALKDRLSTFLEIETETFRELYKTEEVFWKKLDTLRDDLAKAKADGEFFKTLSEYCGHV